jgi:hypothetical protein
MHYKSMQLQAREKHQQLLREAELHRLARQNRDRRALSVARKAEAIMRGAGCQLLAGLVLVGRSTRRLIRDPRSAAHS